MKKFLATMLIAVTALSAIAEADARPMGGGRSFGRQSSSVSRMRAPAPAPAPSPAYNQPSYQRPAPAAVPPQAVPQRRPSMWKNVLGGALLGLGLGALFSHFGIGGAMGGLLGSLLTIVLVVLVIGFLVRLFRRKADQGNGMATFNQQPLPAGVGAGYGSGQPAAWQGGFSQPGSTVLDKPHQAWGVPGGFDADAFLRQAKASFIRLQAAWDRGDTADLREFTSPEVFAELQLQIQERGGQPDYTEVVSIDAQLLGIETTERDYLASVQFNGMIRNAPGAPAEPYVEVWNLAKPLHGDGGWVLAGIQQIT